MTERKPKPDAPESVSVRPNAPGSHVEVEWEGAMMTQGWRRADETPGVRVTRSVGIVYRDEETELTLVQSLNISGSQPGIIMVDQLAGEITIPKSAILKVTELCPKRKS